MTATLCMYVFGGDTEIILIAVLVTVLDGVVMGSQWCPRLLNQIFTLSIELPA